jgi:hypothetical protein
MSSEEVCNYTGKEWKLNTERGLGAYFNMSNLTPNNFIFLHACITSRYFYEISLTFTLSTVHRMTKDQSAFLDLGRVI